MGISYEWGLAHLPGTPFNPRDRYKITPPGRSVSVRVSVSNKAPKVPKKSPFQQYQKSPRRDRRSKGGANAVQLGPTKGQHYAPNYSRWRVFQIRIEAASATKPAANFNRFFHLTRTTVTRPAGNRTRNGENNAIFGTVHYAYLLRPERAN